MPETPHNKAVELTAKSVRSFLTPASDSSSPPALGTQKGTSNE
jgi:hypothetical protein